MSLPSRPDLGPEDVPGVRPPATWRAIEAIPVGLIALGATALFAGVLVALVRAEAPGQAVTDNAAVFALANLFQEAALLGSVLGWVRFVNHGPVAALGIPPREPLKDVWAGILAAVGMVVGSAIVLVAVRAIVDAIAGHQVSGPEQIPDTIGGGYLALTGVVVIVLAPLAEETFFRGFLYTGLRRRYSVWPAALISSFFFGLVHFEGKAFLLIIPSLMVVGTVLALVYERRRSLLASVVAHALFNALGFLTIVLSR